MNALFYFGYAFTIEEQCKELLPWEAWDHAAEITQRFLTAPAFNRAIVGISDPSMDLDARPKHVGHSQATRHLEQVLTSDVHPY